MPRTTQEVLSDAEKFLDEGKALASFRGNTARDNLQLSRVLADADRTKARRWRNAGKVRPAFDDTLKEFRLTINRQVRRFRDGTEEEAPTIKKLREALRRVYFTALFQGLRAGGLLIEEAADLSVEDRRWLESAVRQEMRFMKKFVRSVNDSASNKYLTKRLGAYVDTANSIYAAGRIMAVPNNVVIYWVLDKDADHCPDCLLLRDISPFLKETLPTSPKAGDTQCLNRCRCRLRVEEASIDELRLIGESNAKASSIITRIQRRQRAAKR